MKKNIRDIIEKNNKVSYFKSKLHDAIQLGIEWEGRDIRYYQLNKNIEREQIIKKDLDEVKKAQELRVQKVASTKQ